MKVLYFDCFSGASGDMMLGALLDAGGDEKRLRDALGTLPMAGEFELVVGKTDKGGVLGCDVDVRVTSHEHHHDEHHHHEPHDHRDHDGHHHDEHHHDHDHHGRGLSDILRLLEHMTIEPSAKALAARIFTRLGQAEAKVHGVPVEVIHFHEVGAVDSIVDIVGSAILLDALKPGRVVVSTISVGSGTVRCDHGVLPVPAPATAELLRAAGAKFAAGQAAGELLTPTGAAILAEIADAYGPMPAMTAERIGYGYGKRDTGSLNALRAVVGRAEEAEADAAKASAAGADEVILLEANLDDMTGEALGYLAEALLAAGALDAWHAPILMKKGRPAVTASALCRPQDTERLTAVFFNESTTLGVRGAPYSRKVLPRETAVAKTPFGDVRIKRAGGRARPEYEDVRGAAQRTGAPFGVVYEAAVRAAGEAQSMERKREEHP